MLSIYEIAMVTITSEQTDLIKLCGAREARWSTADNCDLLASVVLWQVGSHQTMTPRIVNDGILNVLDGHGRFVDSQHTGSLHPHTNTETHTHSYHAPVIQVTAVAWA